MYSVTLRTCFYCRLNFKRAKEQNCQNSTQTFDAIKPEKLFKIVEIKNSETQTNLPKFFSIWAAEFGMKDGKS